MIKINSKYNIFTKNTNHEYYFKEFSFIPYPYCEKDFNYELNVKETFSLDMTILAYLYEHLIMYKEVAGEIVDLNYHKFTIKNEILTQGQCIDRMIEDIYIIFSIDNNIWKSEESWEKLGKMIKEKEDDLFDILKECFQTLWW